MANGSTEPIVVDGMFIGNLGTDTIHVHDVTGFVYLSGYVLPEHRHLLKHIEWLINECLERLNPHNGYWADTFDWDMDSYEEEIPHLDIEAFRPKYDAPKLMAKVIDYLVGKHKLTLARAVRVSSEVWKIKQVELYRPIAGPKGQRVIRSLVDNDTPIELRGYDIVFQGKDYPGTGLYERDIGEQ